MALSFDATLTIGSLVTAASVLLSAAALGHGWRQDRLLRRREYADRIRHTAATTAAALERWQILARQTMVAVQPAALEAARIAAGGDRDAARHLLRVAIHEQRARSSQRVAEERLEAAWAELCGYDPRIQDLFVDAISRISAVDDRSFEIGRAELDAILRDAPPGADAADLGDRLCRRCDAYAAAYTAATAPIVEGFRAEMRKLVSAGDDRIIARQVPLAAPDDALPDPAFAVPPTP